jgi:tripartite-type tricarboxylate transporter receptor subunit TctC
MLKLLAGARRDPCRLTPGSASQIARVLPMRAWRAFKSALGFWSNPEEAMQNRLRAAVLGLALLGLAALGLMPFVAQGQAPGSGPSIKLIVPYAAGGLPDTVARVVGRRLQERTGHTVVIENRGGANGGLGMAALVSAPADGQTFVVSDGSMLSTNPLLYSKLPYDPKDVAPVAFLAQAPLFLAVHPKLPVATLKDFIDYVKAHPGQINYGSSGVGSIHHISMEGVKVALNLTMTHIPFKGTGESVPALLGGHVEALFSAYPSLSGAAGTNKITLIATNGAERSSLAPDVSAIAEIVRGFDFATIVGIYARTGVPAAVIQKIAAEANEIVKEPGVIKQLAAVGVEAKGGGPAEFDRALKGEGERVGKVIKAAGIKTE